MKKQAHTHVHASTPKYTLCMQIVTHDQDALVIKLQLQSFRCTKMMQMSDKVYYIW